MRRSTFDLIGSAKDRFCELLKASSLGLEAKQLALARRQINRPRVGKTFQGDMCLNVFCLKPKVKSADDVKKALEEQPEGMKNFITKLETANAYINIHLHPSFMGQVVPMVNDEKDSLIGPLPGDDKDKVMIEYSQPNTHKVFHVGHMRNCALGDCCVRLYEHCGHEVIAANYFGDEGAHVAKCLWALQKDAGENKTNLDEVPEEKRAEWLGNFYSQGVRDLDIRSATRFRMPGIICAKVLETKPHPNNDKWTVVLCDLGSGTQKTVVTAASNLKAGDLVPYCPVGVNFKKDKVAVEVDKKGVTSAGVLMSKVELGLASPTKKKKKNKSYPDEENVFTLNNEAKAVPGKLLTEIGQTVDLPGQIDEVFRKRYAEQAAILRTLESSEPNEMKKLWKKTGQWSLDEFKKIYKWLDVRFDKDFFESEVSETSMNIVKQNYKEDQTGIFTKSEGAIGCDLSAKNKKKDLGFAMLVKSNGSGLYLTKDIALAQKKFEEYKIDRSIYVVDAGQEHHFRQVFGVLRKMGYKQAEKCHHLSYGKVNRKDENGKVFKMSSRDGTIIPFAQLKSELETHCLETKINKGKELDPPLSEAEIENIVHQVSIATIKYGMLNVDPSKDVDFNLDEWACPVGDTGSYLQYTAVRVASILRKAGERNTTIEPDWTLVESDDMHNMLYELSVFQDTVQRATYGKNNDPNPATLCKYLFALSKMFSSWYTNMDVKIYSCEDPVHKETLLQFIEAVARVMDKGLGLLGIKTVPRM